MTEVILLDGGMGQELIARSKNAPTPLWSTRVMLDEPEIVRDVHVDFFRAGAKVATVNTYSSTRSRLEQFASLDLLEDLHRRGCDLAHEARDIAKADALIAGCLPPLIGSYVPDTTPPYEEALSQYRELVALQEPRVDLFICETMAVGYEAAAAARAASESGKAVWVAYALTDDGKLRSGETLAQALRLLEDIPVHAVIANCCRPRAVDLTMDALLGYGCLAGAYPNAFVEIVSEFVPGTTVDLLKARDDFGPQIFADRALGWAKSGMRVLGGCCEIGPAHIEALSNTLIANGFKPVKELSA